MKTVTDFLESKNISYLADELMKYHTTFRIGGNAKLFVMPKNVDELIALVNLCKSENVRFFIVGNGSNLLINDSGIDAVVIHLSDGFDFIRMVDETTIEAGAGVSLAAVCKFALSNGLSGLEFAYGIPGSVGGAAFMNAGAYGGEMKTVVESCSHVSMDGEIGCFDSSALDFGYRKSVYGNGEYIITSVVFKLAKGSTDDIRAKMNELMQRRKDKQPLEYPSAGSIFKRPEGYFAGALIEQSGLKGKKIGGAQVSEKHAGFIVNVGGATCKDVKDLIEFCQETVADKFGVRLETEVKMI
ncbi:MAG: UDP-N-acetylmuramate dehydrogenase [Faecalibacterium sp.]|nr:UDP-N-acetylmuramate dehydrogenase [Ruminococcus sp.]MCM1391609.1 UDP-N-acetylmuramate dehydrogenase [Ruminococcus sp.]MCM1485021.1 UDP-N-acetylmuramate dehydrogenase [Faecalibacterium sp.]